MCFCMNSKFDCFEIMMDEVFKRCSNRSGFTILKSLKLLFFISSVSTKSDRNLLRIFNRFVAMPYGPVESDIYNKILVGGLKKYIITPAGCVLKTDYEELCVDEDVREEISNAIDRICEINPSFFEYTAFQLVDISHKWSCWRICHSVALEKKKYSISMPSTIIENSTKFYSL